MANVFQPGSPRPRRRHELELPPLLAQPQHRRGRRHRHAHAGRPPDRAPHERVPVAHRVARHPLVSTRAASRPTRPRSGSEQPRAPGVEPVPLHGTPAPALPAHVVDAVARGLGRPMQTPPARGLAPLREALSGELARTTGRTSIRRPRSSSRTAPCRLSASASGRCVEPGDEVVVPTPCFFFEGPIRAAGAVPVYVAGLGRGRLALGRRRDRARDRRERHGPCSSAIRATRPATSRLATTSQPWRSSPSGTGSSSSPTRRTRRRSGKTRRSRRRSALGRGRGRDPQPRQEPARCRSCGSGSSPGLPRRVEACARTLEWDCLRVGVAAQEAALAALAGPRDWLEKIHAGLAADREVALAAVARRPGSTPSPRSRRRSCSSGPIAATRLAEPPRGGRPAGRRRRRLPGSRLRPPSFRRRNRGRRGARSARSTRWATELHVR